MMRPLALLMVVLAGCSTVATAQARQHTAADPRLQLVGAPVVVKLGQTFEVRVRFTEALPASPDRTGAHAEFSIGPSTTDHTPVKMKGSVGHCYRQTLYNDLDRASLRRLHAGDRVTLAINVFGRLRTKRHVALSADADAVPRGCR